MSGLSDVRLVGGGWWVVVQMSAVLQVAVRAVVPERLVRVSSDLF